MMKYSIAAFCILLLASFVRAEEGAPLADPYIEMQPSFTVNYGPPKDKISYIKADVSLRVSTASAAAAVERHMPYLRNELVRLLTRQTDDTVTSNEGQQQIREQALSLLNAVLEEEEGESYVDDLLFTSFLVQR